MRYLIVDSSGAGSCLAAFLTQSGAEVDLVAEGAHLSAIQEHDLILETGHGSFAVPVDVWEMANYPHRPDVVFLCVHNHELEKIVGKLQEICGESTLLIPLWDGSGMDRTLQEQLSGVPVLPGRIRVDAEVKAPGEICMHGDSIQLVVSVWTDEGTRTVLEGAKEDLTSCGIDVRLERQEGE